MGRRQNDSAQPPEVRPLDVDGVRTVAIVTVGWGVAFVALALRQGQLNDAGNGWWLWTCLAGVGLGLLGLEYCRNRRDAIAQAALEAEADAGEVEDDDAVGDWSRMPAEQELGVEPEEPPQPDEQQPRPAPGDHITQPYEPGEPAPGYTTGDMPVVPGRIGSPAPAEYASQPHHEHPQQPVQASHEAESQPPGQWPHPQQAPAPQPPQPPAPAPQPQPSVPAAPHYPAAQQPAAAPQRPEQAPAPRPQAPPSAPQGPPSGPPSPHPQQPVQPPAQQPARQSPQPPPSPPQAPPPLHPQPAQPEPPPADPHSTGAGWYDSAAGYTPAADRSRRHPRDRRPESAQPAQPPGSAAEQPPSAGNERPARRPLEGSEFFGDDSAAPAPNSTAEFLLADLQAEDEQSPPAGHDRDAPNEEHRGRRARGSR